MSFLLFLLVGINQALWAGHFFSPEKFSKECERGLSADLSKSLKNSLELISDVERHLRGAERVKFLESIIEEESSLAGNARDLLLSHLIYRHKKNILGVFVSGKRMLGRDFHILAEILLKTTKFVLYDADTEEAAAIGALLGPRGLGVSANKRKYFKTSDFRKIYITENIETKLEILNKVEHVIADDYLFFDVLTLNPDALLKKAKAAKIEPYVLLHSYNKEVDLFQGIYAEGVVNVEKDSFYPPLDFETLTDVNLFKKQILQSSSVSHLFLTASKVLERSQQGYKSSHNTKLELLYAYHHPAQSLDFSIYQNVEAWKIFKNYYQLKNEIAGMSDKTSGPDKTLSVKEKSKAEEKPEKKEEKAEKPKTLSAAWFLSQEKLDYISRILSNEKDPRNRAAKDFFAYSWVKSLMDRNNTVFLQLGNKFEKISFPELEQATLELVKELVKKKRQIIYDYDSYLGPQIAQAAGRLGLGISVSTEDGQRVYKVTNDYFRMKIFSDASHLIVTPDSVAGIGTLLTFDHPFNPPIIFDLKGVWKNGLREWSHSVNSLNLTEFSFKFPSSREVIVSSLSSLLKELEMRNYWRESVDAVPKFEAKDVWNRMTFGEFDRFVKFIENISSNGLGSASDAQTFGNAHMNGVVVFGSAVGHARFEDLVYKTSLMLGQFGVTGATGGSGGFMKTANKAFFEAGALSVGIPISNEITLLKNEKEVNHSLQTLSLNSSEYSSRIPLLIGNRKLLIAAPGSRGTIKEIATCFYTLASELESNRQFIFLSREYYLEFYQWLQQLRGFDFPQSVLDRIKIIDSPEEMKKVFDDFVSTLSEQEKEEWFATKNPERRKIKE